MSATCSKTVLNRRSAYIIRDAASDHWQHRIPATSSERFSLTLRIQSAA